MAAVALRYLLALAMLSCHVPAPQSRPSTSYRVDVSTFGATGDGVVDDTRALLRAVAAVCSHGRGGILYFPAGRYRYSQTLRFVGSACSNVVLEGDGPSATLDFSPRGDLKDTFNDRAIYVESGVSELQPIASPIPRGAVSFQVARAATAQRLNPGQWLVVSERDPRAGEIVIIDWAQVDHVSETNVFVRHPFRTEFPAAHTFTAGKSGLGYQPISSLLENFHVRNVRFVHRDTGAVVPILNIGMALRTRIEDVIVDNAAGNGIAIYRAKDIGLKNLSIVNAATQANEIAATIDFAVTSSSFGFESSNVTRGRAANTAALDIDFGSAFFTVTGNSFHAAGNIGVMLLDGVHDGVFSGNVIGWVRDASIGLGQGLSARGAQRIILQGNVFAGGDRGAGNTCITFADSTQLVIPIPSAGNIIQANSCAGFVNETGPRLRADRYLE